MAAARGYIGHISRRRQVETGGTNHAVVGGIPVRYSLRGMLGLGDSGSLAVPKVDFWGSHARVMLWTAGAREGSGQSSSSLGSRLLA